MKTLIATFVFLLSGLLLTNASFAQKPAVVFTAKLIDELSEEPVPYATVMAITIDDSTMVNGTTTDENGVFNLPLKRNDVMLTISFLGYEPLTITSFPSTMGRVDLGTLAISQSTEMLSEVEVTAERSSMEFKLDKRVFNVGKDISSTGMSAMEVLDNVPSVNVSIEGDVTLRGNSGVQILINGKPSVLSDEGSQALGTITADMIERIEVITNPSAKYEASGTSGIINIVLKKEEKRGFNGSVSLNTGIPDNHSAGLSLNYRTEKFNLFTQMGAGYRSLPRYTESINRNLITDASIESTGTEFRNENFYNITLGTDYHINDNNVITLSGNFALELEQQPSNTIFESYDSTRTLVSQWERSETTSAVNPKYQFDLQYEKQFDSHKDHRLQFSSLGSFFGKEQESEFDIIPLLGTEIDANQQIRTEFYQRDFTFKLDYTNPITEQITIEVGSQIDFNDVGNDYEVNNLINGDWVVDSNLTNDFLYDQKVYGIYGTAAYEGARWGIKLGSRVEHTNLTTLLANTNEENTQVYTNFFPSAHASFKASPTVSFQAGYSRRIFRPRLWDLNPFFNIRNNYNIRRGNPELEPEFGDSYELTGLLSWSKLSLNSSLYYLYTTQVIERVSVLEDNVNITTPMNVGQRHKLGLELNGKYTPAKWVTILGDANYGVFQRQGTFNEQSIDFTASQWNARITTKWQLPKAFDLEFSGNYNSAYQTIQGTVSDFVVINAGLRKKLWEGKAVVNASVRDIFASRIHESELYQGDYFVYSHSLRGRFITLGFSYSFGKGEAMTYTGRRR